MAASIGACVFNDGYLSILQIMNLLEINISQQCQHFAEEYNACRISRQKRRSLKSTKEARTSRKFNNLLQDKVYEEEEELFYGPGIADWDKKSFKLSIRIIICNVF